MSTNNLNFYRNIGISAHIDSGKTTLTERILFYTGRIYKIQEVRGDGSGATMDHMELEKERGITITSAATTVQWADYKINIIDTPGHVDFTVEVERSLRVLDGAILVLCAVSGVQSQSITVDRQMRRYEVPCLAFINKLDRAGANPFNVIAQLKEKLSHNAIAMQIPIGLEQENKGVVDLVNMKAYYFDGDKGENIREEEIPAELLEQAQEYHSIMLDEISLFNDELMEILLEEGIPSKELIHKTIRAAVLKRKITPVFMGSAFKNKGVQLLLDAIGYYLPSPLEREYYAINNDDNKKVPIVSDPTKPLIAMAFKITEEQYGQLTYTRIYQGKLSKGESHFNPRIKKRQRIGRIVVMHSNNRGDVDEASAGDIVALVGIDCASGDTFCDESLNYSMESIYVPEPVIELAIKPEKQEDYIKISKALNRFMKEDPTFHVSVDEESNETRISGMGELQLDVYIERMRREHNASVIVGEPTVNYRETPTISSTFDYKHKKQTGGAGQFAHIAGRLSPLPEDSEESFIFNNNTVGGSVPKEFIPGVEKGLTSCLQKGPLAGCKVIQTQVDLDDGTHHPVDSSELAFKVAARYAFREAFLAAKPVLLEPIMKVEVETPIEFQGNVQGDLSSRRGVLLGNDMRNDYTVIIAEVPLSEMFGYSTDLRSKTQGKASFTMEFLKYKKIPNFLQEKIVEEHKKSQNTKK